MAYLDNSTITVDAVLTKVGRNLLASGQAINPTRIVFTDTEVDYRLWNPSHPSGSAFYGEAIENMPTTEALVKADSFYKDVLVTLPQNSVRLPVVFTSTEGYTFKTLEHLRVTVETRNWAGADSHIVIFPDVTKLSAANVTMRQISGIGHVFTREADMPNARMADFSGGIIELVPQSDVVQRTTQVTFMSKNAGAYKQINFTIEARKLEEPTVPNPMGP